MKTITIILASLVICSSFTPSKVKTDTFTDSRDNQKYQIVKIGDQWWFAQNLNYEVDKSWCYKKVANGSLKIILHHSSLPYNA